MEYSHKLRDQIRVDLFSQNDLKALLPSASGAALRNGVSRALKTKDVIQLKRGLYLFSQKLRKGQVSKFLIANKIYWPSYVSFESALSHYGLIPEGVSTTTSACRMRKTKHFSNQIGDFSYDYVPCLDFFMGVIHDESKGGALVATPLRALFDLVYLRKKAYSASVELKDQFLQQLEQDLRINIDILNKEVTAYSVVQLEVLASQYKKKNVTTFCIQLTRAFK